MKKLLLFLGITAALGLAAFAWSAESASACCPPPANDVFNDATVVTKIPYSDYNDTINASTEQNEPNIDLPSQCTASGGGHSHSVWYKYTPAFEQSVDVDTFGSNFDTVLAAFTGTKSSLTRVACNDDSGGILSALKLNLQPGTTYYFLVGSWGTSPGGTLQFNIAPQDEFYFDNFALKCYQTKIAKRSARFRPQSISTFDANFEFRTETTIQTPTFFCNFAEVKAIGDPTGAVGGEELQSPEDIKSVCYKARDDEVFVKGGGNPAAGARVFAQNEFFGDQKLQLGRLESVCVLALKQHGQLPELSPFNGQILRCYTARPVKGGARPPAVRVSQGDQFFNFAPATLLRPVTYCTLGGKSTEDGCIVTDSAVALCAGEEEPGPTEVAVVCYSLRQASFRPFDIPVIDQFLDQQFVDPFLTIKKADRLCVPSVKKPPFADNDNISNATPVELSEVCLAGGDFDETECRFADHVVTMNATRPRNDPQMLHCASVTDHVDYGHSVWYTFTATNNFNHLDLDTEESSYDTVIAVYSGSKGGLTQLACNDDDVDSSDAPDLQTSDLEVDLQIGQKYFIMIGSKDRKPGGKLKFNVEGCNGQCD